MQNQMYSKQEELYLKAKDAYYNEQPIMSDAEFDALEQELKDSGSSVVQIVGSWDRQAKIPHPTPMRSLEKIQANKTTGEAPVEEFKKWIDNVFQRISMNTVQLEFTQKLDGNAVNLVYENGKLVHALSRGDGSLGRDYITKIDLTQVPTTVPNTYPVIEIRCEAVIEKETFACKYAETSSNERNYVAGVLNQDSVPEAQKKEIHLVPVDMRAKDDRVKGGITYFDTRTIELLGFKYYDRLHRSYVEFKINQPDMLDQFCQLFYGYENYKYNVCDYRVDGMVIKMPFNYRPLMGEVENHPLWALAVKFKPEDCVTKVTGFTMEMGKTGEFTPVALLEPVDLDGSVVTKACAYNYDYIISNSLNVGSLVSLVKSGDIIPQIVKVVMPSPEPYDVLKNGMVCPYCGHPVIVENGKHIKCANPNCDGIKLQKFINSMSALKIFGLGESMMETLFSNVNPNPEFYVTHSPAYVEEAIRKAGVSGKVWEKFINELGKITSLTIEQVIALKSYPGISNDGKTVKEIGKKLSGVPYDFTGLEKSVVAGWEEGDDKYSAVMSIVSAMVPAGIKTVFHEQPTEGSKALKLTLTGSPKSFGYKTKAEYLNILKSKGYSVDEVAINACDYLVTDDLASNSGKMQNAKKLGKPIVTYETTDFNA